MHFDLTVIDSILSLVQFFVRYEESSKLDAETTFKHARTVFKRLPDARVNLRAEWF